MKTLYPRLPDFQALRNRMDPTGKFSNDYLRRVIGS
jgi:FAD/FMN-containing dehydrogenase